MNFIKSKIKEVETEKECKKPHVNSAGASGAVYGLGLIGALIYYIQHATTFMIGLFGILKALVWPAILIYKVFDMLKL